MGLRRVFLMVLGVLGSVMSASALFLSAEDGLKQLLYEDNGVKMENIISLSESVSLPVAISGTNLIAQKISPYEGPFLEDGTDREVVDIAALHVYNSGTTEVNKARIALFWSDGFYTFEADHIPAGETVVILEKNGSLYRQGDYIQCNGWQELGQENAVSNDVSVTEMALGTVVVNNLTDETLRNVCVYYKTWLTPPNVYVGGITYMVQIPVLLPRQSKSLYPYHYAVGYSKVVAVDIDRTDDL
ncbi:MAG: hypothetical protein IJA47_00275 [Oscillospiraceae bacterium]|nr:hypothetical protein [Oscillospiraceae bacterium]